MKYDSILETTKCNENSVWGISLALPAGKKNNPSQDSNYPMSLKDRRDVLTGQEITSQWQREKSIFFIASVVACFQGEVTEKVWMTGYVMNLGGQSFSQS